MEDVRSVRVVASSTAWRRLCFAFVALCSTTALLLSTPSSAHAGAIANVWYAATYPTKLTVSFEVYSCRSLELAEARMRTAAVWWTASGVTQANAVSVLDSMAAAREAACARDWSLFNARVDMLETRLQTAVSQFRDYSAISIKSAEETFWNTSAAFTDHISRVCTGGQDIDRLALYRHVFGRSEATIDLFGHEQPFGSQRSVVPITRPEFSGGAAYLGCQLSSLGGGGGGGGASPSNPLTLYGGRSARPVAGCYESYAQSSCNPYSQDSGGMQPAGEPKEDDEQTRLPTDPSGEMGNLDESGMTWSSESEGVTLEDPIVINVPSPAPTDAEALEAARHLWDSFPLAQWFKFGADIVIDGSVIVRWAVETGAEAFAYRGTGTGGFFCPILPANGAIGPVALPSALGGPLSGYDVFASCSCDNYGDASLCLSRGPVECTSNPVGLIGGSLVPSEDCFNMVATAHPDIDPGVIKARMCGTINCGPDQVPTLSGGACVCSSGGSSPLYIPFWDFCSRAVCDPWSQSCVCY